MCVAPLSYSSTGSSERSRPSTESSGPLVGHGLDRRDRLLHAAEDERARLVPVDLDGNDPRSRLELDDGALERLRQHPRRPEHRVPGERHLVVRVEDPHASGATRLGRKHEGRLREADLERERLHRLGRRCRERR